METLRLILVFLHLLGMASLLAGFLTQLTAATKRLVPAFTHGALTQLVTGVLLVPIRGDAPDVDNAKIGVKAAVLLVILALLWVNRSKESISKAAFLGIGGLTILNVGIAVFWT